MRRRGWVLQLQIGFWPQRPRIEENWESKNATTPLETVTYCRNWSVVISTLLSSLSTLRFQTMGLKLTTSSSSWFVLYFPICRSCPSLRFLWHKFILDWSKKIWIFVSMSSSWNWTTKWWELDGKNLQVCQVATILPLQTLWRVHLLQMLSRDPEKRRTWKTVH